MLKDNGGSDEALDEPKERRGIQASSVIFLIVASLSMIADGFDISAMGFVAPELVKQWHVSAGDLVPAFSAGVIGLLVGAPSLGYCGDRFGRKTAVVAVLLMFGGFTFMTSFATNLTEFVALRFLTGIGLGGLIPNITALAAEIAPKRLRGTFIIIVTFGVPIGLGLPGWVAAALVPTYGWPILLIIGGAIPIVIAIAAWIFVHESESFTQQRNARNGALSLDLHNAEAVPAAIKNRSVMPGRASPRGLFTNGLAFITPVIWVALAANQFTNFFTLSWLPTLLQSSGLSTSEAGMTASMYSVGGLIGGFVLTFIIDRLGVVPLIVLFLLGAPLVASIGAPHISPMVLAAILAGAGFCVTGNNFGFNAIIAMVYPTNVRSMGVGWAQAFGRLGSLAAQVVGGILLGQHLSVREVYFAPAAVLIVGAASASLLLLMCFRRFGGFRLEEPVIANTRASVPATPLTT